VERGSVEALSVRFGFVLVNGTILFEGHEENHFFGRDFRFGTSSGGACRAHEFLSSDLDMGTGEGWEAMEVEDGEKLNIVEAMGILTDELVFGCGPVHVSVFTQRGFVG
jgi:hypothetical protein